MRDRRDICDAGDLETATVEGADSRFATRAGTAHADLDVLQTMLLSGNASLLGSHLGCKGRALARTAETATAGSRPRQGVALTIGDRDDGVVERRVHVRNAIEHIFACFFGLLRVCRGCLLVGHM